MNIRIDQLVRSLLQKDSLEHCSLPELQQFAGKNPYLGAAQLLLAKKMQSEKPEGFEDQLQKTLLYFHNPAWVEHLLNDTGQAEIIKQKKDSPAKESAESVSNELPAEHWPEDHSVQTESESVAAVESISAEPVAIETAQVEKSSEPFAEAVVSDSMPVTGEPENPEPVLSQATEPDNRIAKEEKPAATERDPLLENPAFQTAANDQGGQDLLFEPYHTVDYFASQGIKFREEEKPKDKFGQQLKSFTEWLKTLKKAPATDVNRQNEPATEDKVVKLAENSIRDEDVYTEAMAEVWEKQGNSVKAIDIYLKLSLLEPAKSTYFAAKIEELKKLN